MTLTGAYAGSGNYTGIEAISTDLGYSVPLVIDYGDATSPAKMTSNYYPVYEYTPHLPAATEYCIGVPYLWTGNGGTSGPPSSSYTVADVVAGNYDTEIEAMAGYLSGVQSNMIVRLGWEANGGTMCWAVNEDPGSPVWTGYTAYTGNIALFRHFAPILHSYGLRTCWNMVLNVDSSPDVTTLWPGASYVDVIGLDVYGQMYCATSPNPNETNNPSPSGLWQKLLTQAAPFSAPGSGLSAYGLNWWLGYAEYLGKPIMFPEFGMQAPASSFPNEGGTGDDAYLVEQMANWINNNISQMLSPYPIACWCQTSDAYGLFTAGTPNATAQAEISFQNAAPSTPAATHYAGNASGKRLRLP